ncbi:FAD-dependent oxidoreductase [Curtanaerobium respiraculi]|uniref:FAD-dependent oxidoreductase n=1 Tax=Curtanaerobium respiraculi TaxID=2949669 RepID=UPI0024B37F7B|nr:FAD-dependent oxidoreductase [Curtanaerobium respiraculi]
MELNKTLSRRQFFGLAGIGLATVALADLTGCGKADKEINCDVLVIGGGGAGTTAAAMAADSGAKTILIEKMPWQAGSSSLALGTLYGAGTKLQQAAGIDDTPDALLQYFLSRNGNKLDYDMQRFCADHFGETIDWLQELGVPFKEQVSIKGKDTVPRGHNAVHNAREYLVPVTELAYKNGVEFRFNTPAESLIVDGSGKVCGATARVNHETLLRFNAKQTIIASGGFCRNAEMIDKYMPDYSGVYTEVGLGLTGEGLQMGLDLGAAYIGHGGTNGILACPVEPGQSKLINGNTLWIDSAGNRFANEAGQTHDIYYTVAHFADQKFYAIYDQAAYDALTDALKRKMEFGLRRGMFAKADTVSDAASKLGIDGATAQAALDSYNALAAAGADTQFNKKADKLLPLTQAPYYVLQMGVCTHGSFGGYHVDTQFRVLDEQGNPIPNLYAAGEVCCGTFIYDDYPAGGCGLNFAYTSGRFSGANAAHAALA